MLQSRLTKVVNAERITDGGKETLIEWNCRGSPAKIRMNLGRIFFYLSRHFNGYIESNSADRRDLVCVSLAGPPTVGSVRAT
jgi:hypothetical protein